MSMEGIKKIVAIKASMNRGILSDKLRIAFPNVKPAQKGTEFTLEIPNGYDQWVAGFSSAEGCFSVVVCESPTCRLGFEVRLEFILSQHTRDERLMICFEQFFKCGKYYPNKIKKMWKLCLSKFKWNL